MLHFVFKEEEYKVNFVRDLLSVRLKKSTNNATY